MNFFVDKFLSLCYNVKDKFADHRFDWSAGSGRRKNRKENSMIATVMAVFIAMNQTVFDATVAPVVSDGVSALHLSRLL